MRSLLLPLSCCLPLVAPLAAQAGTFQPFGLGCPNEQTFYELFPAAGFDLANTSFLLQPTATGGYSVIPGPGLDPAFSTAMPLGDDVVVTNVPLGFSFAHHNTLVSSVDICSNGSLFLQSGGLPTANPSTVMFFSQPARIAALWLDLDPSAAANSFYFDTGTTGSSLYAMATWSNCREFGRPGTANTFQVKLFDTGEIVLSYGACNPTASTLVGMTPGNTAADSGSIDLGNSVPFMLGNTPGAAVKLRNLAGSVPGLGRTLQLQTTNVPTGQPLSLLVLGMQRQSLDGALFGMDGCTVFVSLDAFLSQVASSTSLAWSLPIPNGAWLRGFTFFLQNAVFAPGSNQLGVITSHGAAAQIGL